MTLIPPEKYKELEDKAWQFVNNNPDTGNVLEKFTKNMSDAEKEAFELGLLVKSYSIENSMRGIPTR
jgi:hypothetical protein